MSGPAAGPDPARAVHHTGRRADHRAAWVDERGRLFLETDLGFGLVHTLDTALAADAIEAGAWGLDELDFALMPARFGYVLSPAATGQA